MAGAGEALPEGRRGVPLWAVLLAMLVALTLALLILSRVAGPLHALLFPPEVPVPPAAQVVEHQKPKHGPEYWVYRTAQSGQEVAAFYEGEGGTCRYSPVPDYVTDPSLGQGGPYSVAQCQGSRRVAGVGVSWEVQIHTGYAEEVGPTIFRLTVFR